jgi:16S rRNA (cytosine967-C5)-methyltransferase
VVAVDLPGPRLQRLKENLSRIDTVPVALVAADILRQGREVFQEHGLPSDYAAVLVDVPCSNTGVMRQRADVKWRLQEGDFAKHAQQQLKLLQAAARLVAPAGRLVYSTCSLDPEENAQVVQAFRQGSQGAFDLEDQRTSEPWRTGHDGAAAFKLRRVK